MSVALDADIERCEGRTSNTGNEGVHNYSEKRILGEKQLSSSDKMPIKLK